MIERHSAPDQSVSSDFPVSARCRVRSTRSRKWLNVCFRNVCVLVAAMSVIILVSMLFFIGMMGRYALLKLPDPKGVSSLSSPASEGVVRTEFLTNLPSDIPREAGLGPAIVGTLWVCGICAFLSLPVGIATAILLEEYQPKRKIPRLFQAIVQVNISNLAGVPSVVYGVIGLTAFVFMFDFFGVRQDPALEIGAEHFDQFRTVYRGPRGEVFMLRVPVANGEAAPTELQEGMSAYLPSGDAVSVHILAKDEPLPPSIERQKRTVSADETPGRFSQKHWYYFQVPLGRGVLAGSLTLMLVILPVVIIASQEALRAVPKSLREAARGLGATPWQVVRNVTLPASFGSMMTGSILAMGRAIGEAAPILIVAGSVYVSFFPNNLMDPFTVLPMQIYAWATQPQSAYHQLAAGAIIVLLLILLALNALAVLIRYYTQKPLSD